MKKGALLGTIIIGLLRMTRPRLRFKRLASHRLSTLFLSVTSPAELPPLGERLRDKKYINKSGLACKGNALSYSGKEETCLQKSLNPSWLKLCAQDLRERVSHTDLSLT